MNCGCTDFSLCPEAKKLWKLRSSKGRSRYNAHRNLALNYDPNTRTFQKYEGLYFWANNLKPA